MSELRKNNFEGDLESIILEALGIINNKPRLLSLNNEKLTDENDNYPIVPVPKEDNKGESESDSNTGKNKFILCLIIALIVIFSATIILLLVTENDIKNTAALCCITDSIKM